MKKDILGSVHVRLMKWPWLHDTTVWKTKKIKKGECLFF